MDFVQFKAQWLGRVIDYDHVYKYQCVDLILQYIYECYGIASGVSGNAIDYWTATSAPLLAKFEKLTSSAAEQGDIVVLNGLAGNPYGHVGVATGIINANDVEILEQNGSTGNGLGQGADRIRVRYVARSRVAGLLRPKVHATAPVTVVHPYTIESITPKQIKLNKNTHLWGLNYDNFTAINNNPQADGLAGTVLTVTAILHHNIGYKYYLSDPAVASGYNVLDCDDYTPPPPPPAEPTAPHVPPAAPMVIPNSETYEVVTEVGGFLTSNMAINHLDEKVRVPAGSYFVFNKRFHNDNPKELWAVNVTKTAGKPGAWIAVSDNVQPLPEPEVPETPEAPLEPNLNSLYHPFDQALTYVAMRNVPVVDLAINEPLVKDSKTVTMPQYNVTKISGTLVLKNVAYAIIKSAYDKGLWYGLERIDPKTKLSNIELEEDVYSAETTLPERQVTKTLKPIDKLALSTAHLKNIYLGFTNIFGKMKSGNKNKN